MYTPSQELSGLGLSLKPPKWLRDLGASLISQTKVSLPTPAGAVVVDLGDPASVAQLRQAVTGAKFQVGKTAPTAFDQLSSSLDSAVPGGLGTVALVGGALGLLWFMFGRGRR